MKKAKSVMLADARRILVTAVLFFLLAVLAIGFLAYKQVDWYIAKVAFYRAIEENDTETVRELLQEYAGLANSTRDPILGVLLGPFMEYREQNALCCALYASADPDMIKLLVEGGADVNRHPFGNHKDFPILVALRVGEFETALYFVEQGADLHTGTETETAPYNLLAHSDTDPADRQLQYQLFLCMAEQGVSLEPPAEGEFSRTAFLHLACNNADILECLLTDPAFDVDVNVRNDSWGGTALTMAARRRDHEVCALLLAHGADKDLQDADGKTAYDYAVELEDRTLIEMLSDP